MKAKFTWLTFINPIGQHSIGKSFYLLYLGSSSCARNVILQSLNGVLPSSKRNLKNRIVEQTIWKHSFLMPDALICKLGGVIYKILKFTLKNVNKDSFSPHLCSITYRKYNSLILFLTRIFCTKVCHYTLQNIVKTMFTLYGGHILLWKCFQLFMLKTL